MTSAKSLYELWKAHLSNPFPHGRPPAEYGDLDPFDLTSLDTFIAGYVSRVADGESLSPEDVSILVDLLLQLQRSLQVLSGNTLNYFASLAELATKALAASSKH
jgi:hypothetical protein